MFASTICITCSAQTVHEIYKMCLYCINKKSQDLWRRRSPSPLRGAHSEYMKTERDDALGVAFYPPWLHTFSSDLSLQNLEDLVDNVNFIRNIPIRFRFIRNVCEQYTYGEPVI